MKNDKLTLSCDSPDAKVLTSSSVQLELILTAAGTFLILFMSEEALAILFCFMQLSFPEFLRTFMQMILTECTKLKQKK